MIRLLRAALAQRLAIYTIIIVLTIAGALAAAILPVSLYPPLEFSRINVRAENSDLAPSLVQASLTRPLSRELTTLPGVKQVKAQSTQGVADISASFVETAAEI